jgi:hypothetical protein
MNPDEQEYSDENTMGGGRRHKNKSTKKRKENPVLASWRKFVRKVQHEEKITYPEAMKRASKRKSEWQRGGSPEDGEEEQMGDSNKMYGGNTGAVQDFDGNYSKQYGDAKVGGRSRKRRSRCQRGGNAHIPAATMMGGSRRRRSRGTKKRY